MSMLSHTYPDDWEDRIDAMADHADTMRKQAREEGRCSVCLELLPSRQQIVETAASDIRGDFPDVSDETVYANAENYADSRLAGSHKVNCPQFRG